uniref:Uncharacterized protein n=1 Tax=Anguilla anguilla TaxID=7936 RepID=A0A0E9RDH2_ANGAN
MLVLIYKAILEGNCQCKFVQSFYLENRHNLRSHEWLHFNPFCIAPFFKHKSGSSLC